MFRRSVLCLPAVILSLVVVASAAAKPPPPPLPPHFKLPPLPPVVSVNAVSRIKNTDNRHYEEKLLNALDGWLAYHPAEKPYRARIWYAAWHHSGPTFVTPARVALLVWCSVWGEGTWECR